MNQEQINLKEKNNFLITYQNIYNYNYHTILFISLFIILFIIYLLNIFGKLKK